MMAQMENKAPLPRTISQPAQQRRDFAEERKESKAKLGAQVINNNIYDNRRATAKPPAATNRVIPRYNEFANAPQYN
jgi:hypothetical protein